MGKVLVMYDTNSERQFTSMMARLVCEGAQSLGGTEVRIKSVEECTTEDVVWADGIAVGCPTHFANISWPMKKWWEDRVSELWFKTDGKIAASFTSAGSLGGGGEITCQSINVMMMNFGYMTFGITDYVGKKRSLHYGAVVPGQPREGHEIEACKRLGRRLAEWVGTFIDRRDDCHPLKAEYQRFWEIE